jgi:large repetitive protein
MKKLLWSMGLGVLGLAGAARADGIYMTNMRTSLTPASIALLTNPARVPGGQAGDIVEFVLSATIANSPVAVAGAGGGPGVYFTAYLAPGLSVLGASFVTNSTGVTTRPPGQGGHANNGWGPRGTQFPFGAPFAGFLDGRQNDVYGDTGVFYSIDPRTRLFTADGSNIARGPIGDPTSTSASSNGYNVNDTFYKAVDAFNLWDANQVNAFGSLGALGTVPANPAPTSVATIINDIGQGVPPFGAGSAVAGPQTGYTRDNTGAVGPWQRIQYTGAFIADISDGPATAVGTADTPTVLDASALGIGLSDGSPLVGSTNAVRWSDGLRRSADTVFVKIRVRLDATVMSATDGVVANFESTGSDNYASGSKDNPWRYFGPTVSQTASLYVLKEITSVNGAPYGGGVVPAGATLTYRIRYMNLGNLPINITSMTDRLPAGVATVGCAVGTPSLSNNSNGVTIASVSAGTTACPAASSLVTFTAASLPNVVAGRLGALRGGEFTFDVKLATGLANGTQVPNVAIFAGTDVVTAAAASSSSTVTATIGQPADMAASVGLPATAAVGSVVSCSVSFGNIGSGAATGATATLLLSPGLTGLVITSPVLGTGVYNSATGVVTFSNAMPVSFTAGSTISASISFVQPSTAVQVTATTTATNDSNSANTMATGTVSPPGADVTIGITAPTAGTAGQTLTATVTITNNGPITADAVNAVVTLPDGSTQTITAGSLASGGISTAAVVYFVPPSSTSSQTFSAVVSSATPDSNGANNTATASAPLVRIALLSISKTNAVSSVVSGDSTTYTIVASNDGPSSADNTLVRDLPSAGLSCMTDPICVPAGGAVCPATLSVTTFTTGGGLFIPTFPPVSSVTFMLTCNVVATGL